LKTAEVQASVGSNPTPSATAARLPISRYAPRTPADPGAYSSLAYHTLPGPK
jgi:hypothetical protein